MGRKKALFFDVDGTLWNEKNEIPESTVAAIRKVRENGHLVFLNTGRCKSYIQDPKLQEIGFDGSVCGCGTMAEYDGKILFYKKLETDLVEATIRTVRRFGFRPILEGKEYLYLDEEEFGRDPYGQKLKQEMGENLRSISGEWGKWEISKLSCAIVEEKLEQCADLLKNDFEFKVHNAYVAELVPKGYDKGKGILQVCQYLQLDPADTISFGDSVNDLEMLQTAGIGVVMGNGTEIAKAAADYVTSSMENDGIWNACEHLGLLE